MEPKPVFLAQREIMRNLLLLSLYSGLLLAQPQLTTFHSGSTSSLRGLCAVSENICWTSGSEGTVLKTTDGGLTWGNLSPKGYDTLQFRDIHAFNRDTALILSAGLPAVILKTVDGGKKWKRVYSNTKQGVFFDAMDFWDEKSGMAFSDAQGKKLLIILTLDGGDSWTELPQEFIPDVEIGQGGFAASGTCLKTFGDSSVVIGLGGVSTTTLLSHNRGKTWLKGKTPLDAGSSTKGNFSFDFINDLEGICVGGDYTGDSATTHSMAKTMDGGKTWRLIDDPIISGKYNSCVSYLNNDTVISTSRTGISYSYNAGKTWKAFSGSYYTCSSAKQVIWLSGPNGSLAKLSF